MALPLRCYHRQGPGERWWRGQKRAPSRTLTALCLKFMLIACFTFNFALKIVAMSRQAMTTITATIYKEGSRGCLVAEPVPPLGVVASQLVLSTWSGTASINFIDSLLWDFKTHQKTIKYITNTTMFRNLFEDNDFSAQLQYRCMLECPLLPVPPPLFSGCIHMHSYFSILCVARLLWGFAVCRRTLGLEMETETEPDSGSESGGAANWIR